MTNLTEQWKKGELPEGHYYVKDGENMIAEYLDGYFYNNGEPMTSFTGGVDKVLAPVPSYDELQNMNKAVNQAMSENIKLVKQNAQLKELLTECSIANTALVSIMDWLRKSTIPEQRESCEKLFEKTQKLQKLLDEALK